jgi:hypothetical protein
VHAKEFQHRSYKQLYVPWFCVSGLSEQKAPAEESARASVSHRPMRMTLGAGAGRFSLRAIE